MLYTFYFFDIDSKLWILNDTLNARECAHIAGFRVLRINEQINFALDLLHNLLGTIFND